MTSNITPISIVQDSAYWGRMAHAAISDENAFSALYNHFFPRVYQHLMSKTKDSSLADEIVSRTFFQMYRHLSDYDPEKGAFSTWLFRIARNELNMHYRSKAYTANEPFDDAFEPSAPEEETPEAQALTEERHEELRQALEKLSERDRRLIMMTYWLDMKSEEIAQALDMKPNTVRVTLKRARDELRKYLGKD